MLRVRTLSYLIALVLPCYSSADMVETKDYAPWETCALCHSYTGDSAMAKFPKLNGQKRRYLEKQIIAFREGHRKNDGGQMTEMVALLADVDIARIVEWFSSQAHPLPFQIDLSKQQLEAARRIVNGKSDVPACRECHQEVNEAVPWIASQHASYLEKQLRDFKEKSRQNDGNVMHDIASKLSDKDITLVAKYVSSLERDRAGMR